MNILAAALVQVIGLAVLRDEPQMGGMHVILPSVTESSHVEPHSAILVFKNSDRVDDGGEWPSSPLTPVPGYSYVALRGERIRFFVNGTNRRARIPAALPHLARNNCPSMSQLHAGYQPPAYAAAAGVALIPRGFVRACRADAPGVQGRIDTKVTIANTGNYEVVAGNKAITLRNNALVMIVNAPTAWVEGTRGDTLSHTAHSQVYFTMAGNPLGVLTLSRCMLKPPAFVSTCTSVFFALRGRGSSNFPPSIPMPQTTFECSNTQWP